MNLELRTLNELLTDFDGPLPEQIKMLNLVYTLHSVASTITSVNGQTGEVVLDAAAVGAPTLAEVQTNRIFIQNPATAYDATATMTAAALIDGIITSTTAAAVNLTLPLGADLETALTALYGAAPPAGAAIKFKIMNIGPSGITLVTNTGWTIVGSTDIGTWFYAECIARRTGAGTYTLYRA